MIRQILGHAVTREFRALRRGSLSAAVGISSLAVGLAVWTAAVVLLHERTAAPPYTDPSRLVVIAARDAAGGCARCVDVVPRHTLGVWAASGPFERAAAYATQSLLLGDTTAPVRVSGALVEGEFFRTLGTEPQLGRVLDTPGLEEATSAVVISHELWQREFAGSAAVLGGPLRVDGRPYTVVGVMPPRFDFPNRTQIWLPLDGPEPAPATGSRTVMGIARLAVSVAPDVAERRLAANHITEALARGGTGDVELPSSPRLLPLLERVRVSSDHTSRILGGALLVLAIACVNFGLLGAYHAAARTRERAIRSALGAPPGAAVWDVVVEIGLHAFAAAAGGTLLAMWTTRLLGASLGIGAGAALEWRIVAVATLTSMLCAGGVAVVRIPVARRTGARPALQSEANPLGASLRVRRLRNAFVAVQAALAVVSAVIAVCLFVSYRALHRVDLGVDALQVLVANAVPTPTAGSAGGGSAEPGRVPFDAVIERALRVPGVARAAAWRMWRIPSSRGTARPALVTDAIFGDERRRLPQRVMDVTPDYFGAVGLRVLQGRSLGAESAADPHTVVVNAYAAALLWPGEPALGRQLRLRDANGDGPWLTVIGVVSDSRAVEPVALLKAMVAPDQPTALLYRSLDTESAGLVTIAVRQADGATVNPLALWAAIRTATPDAVVEVPVSLFEAMSARVADVPWTREGARLMFGLATVAILLVGCALYAVVGDEVRRRAYELAIRKALGAGSREVVVVVLRPLVAVLLLGLTAGVAALVLARVPLRALLYDVSAADPVVLTAAVVVVLACGALACVRPLRRMLATDPAATLRST